MSAYVESARSLLAQVRGIQDAKHPGCVFLPAASRQDVLREFARLQPSRVRHLAVVRKDDRLQDEYDLVISRQLAKRGASVFRLYVIPHVGFARESLRTAVEKDVACGISSATVSLSRVPLDEGIPNLHEAWFFDEAATVEVRADEAHGDPLFGTVSVTESEDSQGRFRRLWDALSTHARSYSTGVLEGGLDLEEPLILSADLLGGIAPILCCGGHVDHSDCSWYHGTWQFMRLMNLVSTPTWHHDFYVRALQKHMLGRESSCCLITGTADYSMLAYVLAAGKANRTNVACHVLDLCATPLFACRWFARINNTLVMCHQTDILASPFAPPVAPDLICTDAFLTRFAPDAARKVVQGWADALRLRGGHLVTTVRVRQNESALRPPEDAVTDFVDRARARLTRWKPFLRTPPSQILSAIETYARLMVSNVIGDEQVVHDLLRSAGFVVEHSQVSEVPGELYPSRYVRLYATRHKEITQ